MPAQVRGHNIEPCGFNCQDDALKAWQQVLPAHFLAGHIVKAHFSPAKHGRGGHAFDLVLLLCFCRGNIANAFAFLPEIGAKGTAFFSTYLYISSSRPLALRRARASLDAYSHFFHATYGAKLRDADFRPRRLEFDQNDLCDMLRQRFEQRKMFFRKRFLYALRNQGVIQCILKIIGLASATCRQFDFQIKLDRLRGAEFPRVNPDQCFNPEFVQEDDVHYRKLRRNQARC